MSHDPFLKDYLGFMRWLQQQHPDLYMQYGKFIEMANFNTDSHFSNMDEHARKKLEQLQKEYFDSLN